jgi:hypothetical protein
LFACRDGPFFSPNKHHRDDTIAAGQRSALNRIELARLIGAEQADELVLMILSPGFFCSDH